MQDKLRSLNRSGGRKPMRFAFLLVSSLGLLFAIAAPAMAATQADRDDCKQSGDQDRRIAGCTRVVEDRGESAAERAAAYNNRGAAFQAKGDGERASRDFSEANALEPK
jgi:hypothetical protein